MYDINKHKEWLNKYMETEEFKHAIKKAIENARKDVELLNKAAQIEPEIF